MPPVTEQREIAPCTALAADGTIPDGYEPTLADERVLEAYELMLLARVLDEKAFSLQRQGRLGTFSPVTGQEASIVGSALALERTRDWIVPQYRELPALLHHGDSIERFLLYFMGSPAGGAIPQDVKVLPYQISLAAQIPHAVGLAWGLRHQGGDGVVCVYFGDGASSEGDFHEACNLAGVMRAPVVFFLQNNGWAISTPVAKQTAAPSFAARAAGYGIHGELVDGNDLLAVHEVASRAVARAREGGGATLVESRAYRLGPHNTADDPTRYVDPDELEVRRALDPLVRVRSYLRGRGLLDDAAEEALRAQIGARIAAAVAAAEAHPEAQPAQLFEHVYAEPPASLLRQRAAALGEAEGA